MRLACHWRQKSKTLHKIISIINIGLFHKIKKEHSSTHFLKIIQLSYIPSQNKSNERKIKLHPIFHFKNSQQKISRGSTSNKLEKYMPNFFLPLNVTIKHVNNSWNHHWVALKSNSSLSRNRHQNSPKYH